MIRMEVACLLTLIFMSVVFFSVERERGQLDKLFSVLLITTMVHIVFDGITLMTVNNMDKVPGWLNDIMHRVFLVSLVSVCYMIYCYMVLLIEQESGKKSGISKISFALLLIFAVTAMFLPIEYIENRVTNYSFGPAVYTTYASVYLFLIWAAVLFIKNRNKMYRRTRFAVGLALSIFVFVATYQAIRPVSLISSMGFTLIILSFYLGLENPDIYLARQKEKEKEIAEKANASKSVFISNMSHELRTLMNANVGMADILLGTELTNEQREYLNNIRNAGGAVISIINDLLDVSKIEAGRMELVEDEYELKELVEDVRVIIENKIGRAHV